MVPKVCLKIPELKLWIRTLSFFLSFCLTYSFATPIPSSLSSVPHWRIFVEHVRTCMSICITCIYVHVFWSTRVCTQMRAVFTKCFRVCVSQTSVNGKFPHGLLHSHLNALFLFSIPLCHPPVRLLSCLTPVFVSSREGIENTTCHKLFGGLSLFLHGRVFIIP